MGDDDAKGRGNDSAGAIETTSWRARAALAQLRRVMGARLASVCLRGQVPLVDGVGGVDLAAHDPWTLRPDREIIIKDLTAAWRLCVVLDPASEPSDAWGRQELVASARAALRDLMLALGLRVRGRAPGGASPLPAELAIPIDWIRRAS